MADMIEGECELVEKKQAEALAVINDENEPEMELSEACKRPYDCAFINYCMRDIPSPSVFDLYRMTFSKKLE
jgi:hypothetical protein